MHISEGVLSAPVLATGAVASVVGVAIGLKNLEHEEIPKTSIVTSALFIASLIHVPLGPTSVHLILNGIAGIFLGWKLFPAALISFFLQAVLFQHGGLTSLGVNVFNIALPGILSYYLFKLLVNRKQGGIVWLSIGSFICGALSILLTVLMVIASLLFTQGSFMEMGSVIFLSHLPVMIIEGILSAICVVFIVKTKSEIMEEAGLKLLNL